ncbi:MAG: cupin domain-containing protein [Candidatus Saccharimonadales bacterium]
MKGYYANIEDETIKNQSFRKVAYTGAYSQLVYMKLKPGESIGQERHGNDQFFRFEHGTGLVTIDDNEYKVKDGSGVIVPAGATHNVTNTSAVDDLHLYTIYSVPHHLDGAESKTKAHAEAKDLPFDGRTTEHQTH